MQRRVFKRWMSGSETRWSLLLLLFLGVMLRLPWLDFPQEVVFDEAHFGKFVTAYCCTHEDFFDIHPPHAKLLIAGAATLGGYQGGFDFDHIGLEYPDYVPLFMLRLAPAIAGILLPLVLFVVVRFLGGSVAAAFATGFIVVCDNAVLMQTHFLLLDGWLWLGLFSALACLLRAQQFHNMRERVVWLILCGIAMGMAVGTKLTGLTAGVVVLALLLDEFLKRKTLAAALIFVRQCVWIGLPFLLTYLAGWVLHFQLLTEPGPGHAFYRPSGDFFKDIVVLHEAMLTHNYNTPNSHPDASAWWTWPFMVGPVFYWSGPGRVIYLAGNPLVWWGTTAVGVTALMIWLLQSITRLRLPEVGGGAFSARELSRQRLHSTTNANRHAGQATAKPLLFWVPVVAYIVSYLPMAGIPRGLFLYHYIPSFLFALVFVVLWLERCGWTAPNRSLAKQPRRYWGVLLGAVVGFVLMLPLTGVAGFEWWRSFLLGLFSTWR